MMQMSLVEVVRLSNRKKTGFYTRIAQINLCIVIDSIEQYELHSMLLVSKTQSLIEYELRVCVCVGREEKCIITEESHCGPPL